MKLIATTQRLTIREFTPDDAGFILYLVNTSTWLRFIGDRNIRSLHQAENYLVNGPIKSYTQHGFGLYLVSLKHGSTPIGMCGLIKRETLQDADLGFSMLPEFEGLGYAFEAASAILIFAKNTLHLKRLLAITSTDNNRSAGLLSRLGFVFQKNIIHGNEKEELMLFEIPDFN